MARFFIARNMDSDGMFHQALLSAGYTEADHPSLSDFIIHDAVHPGLERYLDSQPIFITPHTPQSSFLWDGILEPTPVSCNFVYGEAGKISMEAYGYPYRVETVGFARCEVREFKPTAGCDVLIVPAHPSRRGQYTNPMHTRQVSQLLQQVMAQRKLFGKVTLCWSETRLDPELLQEMERRNIARVIANPWSDPEPLKHMIERIDAVDLVISCNTTGCVAVARGKPTVFFAEDETPTSGPQSSQHSEKYREFLRFPLHIDSMTLENILAVREKPNAKVEMWKRQNIGGNFNAEKFIGVVREYIK